MMNGIEVTVVRDVKALENEDPRYRIFSNEVFLTDAGVPGRSAELVVSAEAFESAFPELRQEPGNQFETVLQLGPLEACSDAVLGVGDGDD